MTNGQRAMKKERLSDIKNNLRRDMDLAQSVQERDVAELLGQAYMVVLERLTDLVYHTEEDKE